MSRREVLRCVFASELIQTVRKPTGWLVEHFWADRSQGIVAGEPKTYKSMLTLDMAVSVASGTPFLGRHKVKRGAVLIIQEENDDETMKSRLVKIMCAKGLVPRDKLSIYGADAFNILFATDLPLMFINRRGFSLDNEQNMADITNMIIGENIRLLILDPFYFIFSGNINDMQAVKAVLKRLSILNRELNVSIMLVHHNHKPAVNPKAPATRGGQKMMGSMSMHAWTASALYLTRSKKKRTIHVEREFRAFSEMEDVKIVFSDGETSSFQYETAEVRDQKAFNFENDR